MSEKRWKIGENRVYLIDHHTSKFYFGLFPHEQVIVAPKKTSDCMYIVQPDRVTDRDMGIGGSADVHQFFWG